MRMILGFLSIILLLMPPVRAAEPIQIVGYQNTRLLPSASEGPYGRLMKSLLDLLPPSVTFQVFPGKRANLMMYGGQRRAHCEFPSALEHVTAQQAVKSQMIESDAVNYARAHVFTRPESSAIRRLDELHGKRVGIVRGFGYGATINELIALQPNGPISFVEVSDELQHVRLLTLTDRVDAILGYLPEIAVELAEIGVEGAVYDPGFPLLQTGDRLLCHRSQDTAQLILDFNRHLAELRANGSLKRIMGIYYLPQMP